MKAWSIITLFAAYTIARGQHEALHAHMHARDIVGVGPSGICPTITAKLQPVTYCEYFPYTATIFPFRNGVPFTVSNVPTDVCIASTLTKLITVSPGAPNEPVSVPSSTSSESSASAAPPTSVVTVTVPLSTSTQSSSSTITTTPAPTPGLVIGQGLPSAVVGNLPDEKFIFLAFTNYPLVPRAIGTQQEKARRQEQPSQIPIDVVNLASYSIPGGLSQDMCDSASPLLLRQGTLVQYALTVGKRVFEATPLLSFLDPPPVDEVNTRFNLDNGVLTWTAADFNVNATFYDCGGLLYAGFNAAPTGDCRAVIVGAIAGSVCIDRVRQIRAPIAAFVAPIPNTSTNTASIGILSGTSTSTILPPVSSPSATATASASLAGFPTSVSSLQPSSTSSSSGSGSSPSSTTSPSGAPSSLSSSNPNSEAASSSLSSSSQSATPSECVPGPTKSFDDNGCDCQYDIYCDQFPTFDGFRETKVVSLAGANGGNIYDFCAGQCDADPTCLSFVVDRQANVCEMNNKRPTGQGAVQTLGFGVRRSGSCLVSACETSPSSASSSLFSSATILSDVSGSLSSSSSSSEAVSSSLSSSEGSSTSLSDVSSSLSSSSSSSEAASSSLSLPESSGGSSTTVTTTDTTTTTSPTASPTACVPEPRKAFTDNSNDYCTCQYDNYCDQVPGYDVPYSRKTYSLDGANGGNVFDYCGTLCDSDASCLSFFIYRKLNECYTLEKRPIGVFPDVDCDYGVRVAGSCPPGVYQCQS